MADTHFGNILSKEKEGCCFFFPSCFSYRLLSYKMSTSTSNHFKFSGKYNTHTHTCTHSLTCHVVYLVGDAFDSLRTIRVPAKDGRSGQDIQLQYSHQKVIGNGSFGVVYQVKLDHNGEDAAIKKVLQDKRFKVRRLLRFHCVIFIMSTSVEPRAGDYEAHESSQHLRHQGLFLLARRK